MKILQSLKSMVSGGPRLAPTEVASRVRSGEALLVDVREPAEWASGVAQHARLLPLSDLTGARVHWTKFLREAAGREVLLYCASGMRSGTAAKILSADGIAAANTGALSDWKAADWPIVPPPAARS